jgi:hypothetical protein
MNPSIPPRGSAGNRHDAPAPAIKARDVIAGAAIVDGPAKR